MGSGRVRRPPGLEVIGHRLRAVDRLRKLQRQAAGRIGAKVEQAGRAQRAAGKRGQVLAGGIRQRQGAARLCIARQRRREGLADRADLEQGRLGDGLAAPLRRHAIVEEILLTTGRHRDGHARHVVRLHHRRDRLVDGAFELARVDLVGGVRGWRAQEASGGKRREARGGKGLHVWQ
ncbi:hypothetical protein D3C81_1696860 [compost metagenome]